MGNPNYIKRTFKKPSRKRWLSFFDVSLAGITALQDEDRLEKKKQIAVDFSPISVYTFINSFLMHKLCGG